MADLADRCATVVQRYGCTVDKFTGDGIMAVFGGPVALEDHAVRACLAALGVQEEAKRLAVEVHERDGVKLPARSVRGSLDTQPLASRSGWLSGWSRSLRRVA
jgi:class 3 adenylate cyclase